MVALSASGEQEFRKDVAVLASLVQSRLDEEFDEVGAEIARALDHFNVPEREKQEVLAAIVARKSEVVNG